MHAPIKYAEKALSVAANGLHGLHARQAGVGHDLLGKQRDRSLLRKDLAEDRHLNERGFFTRLPHPEVGVQTHTGIPWRLSNGPNGVRKPAPVLGEDTDAVMREILNYSDEEIPKLELP